MYMYEYVKSACCVNDLSFPRFLMYQQLVVTLCHCITLHALIKYIFNMYMFICLSPASDESRPPMLYMTSVSRARELLSPSVPHAVESAKCDTHIQHVARQMWGSVMGTDEGTSSL